MARKVQTPAKPVLSPLAQGTKVATIGTFYGAEVVSSEVNERGCRVTVVRWADDTPGIVEATRLHTWVQVPGRTPRFIVCADQG